MPTETEVADALVDAVVCASDLHLEPIHRNAQVLEGRHIATELQIAKDSNRRGERLDPAAACSRRDRDHVRVVRQQGGIESGEYCWRCPGPAVEQNDRLAIQRLVGRLQ